MLRCTLAVTAGSVKPKIDLGCTQDALRNISDTGIESYCVLAGGGYIRVEGEQERLFAQASMCHGAFCVARVASE